MPYELLFTALMVEKYQNTCIYGLGVTLYGPESTNSALAESTNSTLDVLPQEVIKSSVWDIVEESTDDKG